MNISKRTGDLIENMRSQYSALLERAQHLRDAQIALVEKADDFTNEVDKFEDDTDKLSDRLGHSPIIDFRDALLDELDYLSGKFEMGLDHFLHSQKGMFDFVCDFEKVLEETELNLATAKTTEQQKEEIELLQNRWMRVKKVYDNLEYEFNERNKEVQEMIAVLKSGDN